MHSRCLMLALAGLFLCATASAAEYPPAINALVKQNKDLTVIKSFPAPAKLTGYVIKENDRYLIVYATADGKHVLIGNLLDQDANSVTQQETAKYVPKPDLTHAWKELEKASWIAEGAKDPKTIIYEFVDPNCPFCHLFWLANQPYMKVGLQVRHILVGFLSPSSTMKAAAILSAKDPTVAFLENEAKYRSGVPESQAGGVKDAAHPDKAVLARIDANSRLMQKLEVNGTPGVFYKDKQGKVRRIVGLPKLSTLPGIYNLPRQPVTDAALKRFE